MQLWQPLQHAAKLSSITNCDAYVKREDLQPVFSFKIRGAYNRIVNLGDVKGVVACSAGKRKQLFYPKSSCRYSDALKALCGNQNFTALDLESADGGDRHGPLATPDTLVDFRTGNT